MTFYTILVILEKILRRKNPAPILHTPMSIHLKKIKIQPTPDAGTCVSNAGIMFNKNDVGYVSMQIRQRWTFLTSEKYQCRETSAGNKKADAYSKNQRWFSFNLNKIQRWMQFEYS